MASMNPVNLWKDLWNGFDTGYLTDQRVFSDAPNASARMRSWLEVKLDPLGIAIARSGHESSGTTEVDLETGEKLGFEIAKMKNCVWSMRPTVPSTPMSPRQAFPGPAMPGGGSVQGKALVVTLIAAACDPLVSASADIDYEGEFVVTPGAKPGDLTVEFTGKIDSFPAFEAYASLNGKTKTLFTADPPPGNTVTSLPGRATRPVRARVAFP